MSVRLHRNTQKATRDRFNHEVGSKALLVTSWTHAGICLTNVSQLCYNSTTERGQLLWVTVRVPPRGTEVRFCVVFMVSINSGIRVYGVDSD